MLEKIATTITAELMTLSFNKLKLSITIKTRHCKDAVLTVPERRLQLHTDGWSEGTLSMLGMRLSFWAAHRISIKARTTCIKSAILVAQGMRYCSRHLPRILRHLKLAL